MMLLINVRKQCWIGPEHAQSIKFGAFHPRPCYLQSFLTQSKNFNFEGSTSDIGCETDTANRTVKIPNISVSFSC
ncbi:hypothetical protein AHF37_09146 [Paragonimus kellicotti]|nr:hypothetical protein AHF37_09146 [Paragonimus kellicotti]